MRAYPPTADGKLTFGEWVNYCFDRPSDTWHWTMLGDVLDADGSATPSDWYRPDAGTLCDHLTRLFRRPGILLHRFTGDQLNWVFLVRSWGRLQLHAG